jgi:hypothetical protein
MPERVWSLWCCGLDLLTLSSSHFAESALGLGALLEYLNKEGRVIKDAPAAFGIGMVIV